jgi:dienelactone hydrolase
MTSRSVDSRILPSLQPATALWAQYQPEKAPNRFSAQNLADALDWQKRIRPALEQTVGFQQDLSFPLQPELIEEVDKGDYLRQKVLLHTAENVSMPVYLLIPKGASGPLPTVIAFHGHGYGVKDIVGLWENGEERDIPDGYHKDFGVALCRRGFFVAAPEIACFGERQTDFSYLDPSFGQEDPGSCTHTAMLAFTLGGSVVGMRVRDGRRLVDYLSLRPEVDLQRLGAMGISGGGMHTFFSTCLDERIKACVVSGYFSPYRNSILAMHHCACNFIPGLARFGEIYDLAGLIAPRPMLVEAGTHDPIFPIDAVREAFTRASQVYSVFGASADLEIDVFEGRHQISGRRAYDFLAENLA